jgi:uncharacterized membrane protein (GlpM family)
MILYFVFLIAFYLFYRDMENNDNVTNLKILCGFLAAYFIFIMKG